MWELISPNKGLVIIYREFFQTRSVFQALKLGRLIHRSGHISPCHSRKAVSYSTKCIGTRATCWWFGRSGVTRYRWEGAWNDGGDLSWDPQLSFPEPCSNNLVIPTSIHLGVLLPWCVVGIACVYFHWYFLGFHWVCTLYLYIYRTKVYYSYRPVLLIDSPFPGCLV
jgi:hypothetical protein